MGNTGYSLHWMKGKKKNNCKCKDEALYMFTSRPFLESEKPESKLTFGPHSNFGIGVIQYGLESNTKSHQARRGSHL